MRIWLSGLLVLLAVGAVWTAYAAGPAHADFGPPSGLTIHTRTTGEVPVGGRQRVNLLYNEGTAVMRGAGYLCAGHVVVQEQPPDSGHYHIDTFVPLDYATANLDAVNAELVADNYRTTTAAELARVIDIIRYGNFCYIAFDVASVINHCFVIQVTTPGTMRANPDPGVVGVEAWFWVEGILGGDPSYTQLPGGHPRITGSGNRYTVNLAATGTGLWSGPDPGEPGAITADGVWLDTTESYGSYDCDTQGLGMMINWQHWPRATGVELFEAEHLYPVASLEEGGRWRQVAWDAIRAQLQGPDPGATPTARMRAVDGEIGVVPARTRFAGRLELEEYQWTFEPGDVGDGWTYDAGGAGLQPTQAHFANPSTYSGEVRYTYDYHGLFNARVSVIRRLVGDLTYRYYETYHYEDVFARTWYPQVHRSWGTTSCRRVTFPSTGPLSGDWRQPQECLNEEVRYHTWEAGFGTPIPAPDPLPDPPPPPPPDSCTVVILEYVNGSLHWSQGSETAGCTYDYYGAGSHEEYRFDRSGGWGCESRPFARQAIYREAEEDCVARRRHQQIETLTANAVSIPSVADLPVEHSYPDPQYGYPARRVIPYQVPNP